ncbi:MAG: nickel-responsive transcriptional regulator NikR [Candidatus Brocadiaceae bacterium]|nr:nickel-responsive transcriptional regulator NikR [Candidatus Brocadiaceae bacterium]
MTDTVRFGVSLGLGLLDEFDQLIRKQGYPNRSEAVRDLIRRRLLEEAWQAPEHRTFAVLTLIYDHHTMGVSERLMELQHESHTQVIGSFHVHVDKETCLEAVVLKGRGRDLRALADRMIALKGVQYGHLNMAESVGHAH